MKQAVVIKGVSPLMESPRPGSERVDEVLYGMVVDIVEEAIDGWCEVNTDYNYKGYIQESNLCFCEDHIKNPKGTKKKVVLNNFVDFLYRPKYNSMINLTVPKGSIVTVIGEPDENGFIRVSLCSEGEDVYVKESHLGEYKTKPVDNEDKFRQELVYTALSYLGTQYRWGGKSPLGIDCSGLVSMAYMINGVNIYRDAKIMEGFPIKEIPFEDLKKGDLLYFPGHVAMYIGDNLYVHSTGKNGYDGVVINSLNPNDVNFRKDLAEALYAIGSIFNSKSEIRNFEYYGG